MSFNEIANNVIYTDKYQSLKNEPHHGITRYDHVMRVAKNTYKISKLLKMDYVSATRGALLHDYFNNDEYKTTRPIKKGGMHPVIALNNARKEFDLNEKEENIIVSHMFPMGKIKPNCKESWLVSAVDKTVATFECSCYKWRSTVTLWMLFMINIISK